MMAYSDALVAESMKARRSIMPWVTLLGSVLVPLVGGLFMLIFKDPAWASRFGLLTTKAQLTIGAADWPTYFGLLTQAIAIGGLILFGMITVWIFGREWSDRTIIDLLALPTTRVAIAGAKFMVIICWSLALTTVIYVLGLAIGSVVGLDGWSTGLALDAARRVAMTAMLTIAVVLPFAWAASVTHGYLPAIGMMFLAVFLAQILAALGWGSVFPWSIPALFGGVAGPGTENIGGVSFVVVALTGLVGIGATLAWWQYADQQ